MRADTLKREMSRIMASEQEGLPIVHGSFQRAFEVIDLGPKTDRHERAVSGFAEFRPEPNGCSGFERWAMEGRTPVTFLMIAAVDLRP